MYHEIKSFCTALPLIIVIATLSCSDSENGQLVNSLYMYTPHVSDIMFTDNIGNEIGEWGNPSDEVVAYPNPFDSSTTIGFYLSEASEVKVWIVHAIGPGETDWNIASLMGAQIFVLGGAPVVTLFDSVLPAGGHDLEWDGRNNLGRRLQSGFYRIYVLAGYEFAWADILLMRDCSEIVSAPMIPGCD